MNAASGLRERSWIDPARVRFRSGDGGMLEASWDGRSGIVIARRLFPVTHKESAVWVGEFSGAEWGVLRTLEGMDRASREALEGELRLNPFLPRIESIEAIQRRFGQFHWTVATDFGPFAFRTGPLYEAVTTMPGGQRIITDTDEQRYLLPNEEKIDERTRRRLAKWF